MEMGKTDPPSERKRKKKRMDICSTSSIFTVEEIGGMKKYFVTFLVTTGTQK